MHVAICSDGVFPEKVGGMQRHTRLLADSLARIRPEIRVTVLHTHPGKILFAPGGAIAEIAVSPRPQRSNFVKEYLELSERFAAELRRIPDAIVYSQGLTVLSGISEFTDRLVVNPHGLEAFQSIDMRGWAEGIPMRWLQRRTFRHARHVVSLGGRLTDILRRETQNLPGKVIVLPNGVGLPEVAARARAPRPGSEPMRMIFVGRLARNKGVADLLEAMRIIQNKGRAAAVKLDIVGKGPLLDLLRPLGRELGVTFHAGVADAELDRLYAESDVLVLPTLFEGMPTVVLEAMARRLAILVTDVGATRELVDADNGAIIPKGDPPGLARAILELADAGPQAWTKLGAAGRDRVEAKFTWEKVAERHFELFRTLYRR